MTLNDANNYKGTRHNLPVLDDACDLTDEECATIIQETHDNLVRSLVGANGEIHELRKLLTKAYEQLMLLGYDSGFTNEAIDELINDITKYLMED